MCVPATGQMWMAEAESSIQSERSVSDGGMVGVGRAVYEAAVCGSGAGLGAGAGRARSRGGRSRTTRAMVHYTGGQLAHGQTRAWWSLHQDAGHGTWW